MPYYDYDPYGYIYYDLLSPLLALLAAVLALAAGLALYFMFVRKPNTHQGAAAKLHDLLNFHAIVSGELMRLLYALAVSGVTVCAILLLFTDAVDAVLLFLLGNIGLRILFELVMLFVGLCRDVREIRQNLCRPACEPDQPASQTAVSMDVPVVPDCYSDNTAD